MVVSPLQKAIGTLLGVAFGLKVLDPKKEWWVRAAYGAVGYDFLRVLWQTDAGVATAKLAGGEEEEPSVRSISTGAKGAALNFEPKQVRNLDERVAYIHKQMVTGTKDPKVYALARAVLSRKCNGSWCLPQGTLLVTPSGVKPIEQIQVGESVAGDGTWTEVKAWFDTGSKPLLHFALDNGTALRCTAEHKVFVMRRKNKKRPARRDEAVEVRADEVREGDELLQPERLPPGTESLSVAEAVITGAYVAEGWVEPTRVSVAGIEKYKGVREAVIEAAKALDLKWSSDAFKVRLMSRELVWRLSRQCGVLAANKHLPHVNWDLPTTRLLVEMLNADARAPGRAAVKSPTFNTTSRVLAEQYRLLQRRLGFSSSMSVTPPRRENDNPVYVVHVRQNNTARGRRYWVRVKSVTSAPAQPTFDIETASQRIYLPESDVVVHNCVPEKDSLAEVRAIFGEVRSRVRYTWDPVAYDAFQTPGKTLELGTGDCDDEVALLGAMLRSVGYTVRSRVVHTKGFSTWNHIYLLVQLPTSEWMALDPTVDKPAGWEVPHDLWVKQARDFDVKE